MTTLKALFTSKKFLTALATVLFLILNQVFNLSIDEETQQKVMEIVMVYIGGQALVDASKHLKK